MNAEESQPIPDSASVTSTATHSVDPSARGTNTPGAARRLPLWLLTLGAGLISGLISWAGGEAMFDMFRIEDEAIYPPNYEKISGYARQAANSAIQGAAQRVVERKKAATSFGLLGLVLAAGLGLTGGLAAGSSRTAVVGVVIGGLAGTAAGSILSWAVVPLFFRFMSQELGLLVLFMTLAAIFAGVGAASGLALGLGLGDRLALGRAIFGGLLGSLVGTIAFEAVLSLAFPLMRTLEPIATERSPRLSMYLCVAVCVALLAGWAAGRPARKRLAMPADRRES